MTPVDRGLERLLPLHDRARTACEQAEAIVELSGDLLERQAAAARRSELDRQRNPVEAATDPNDGIRGVVGEDEVRTCTAGTFEE